MEAENLKNKAYKIIKDKIICCELLPGVTIDEKSIIKEIGVSRTPIREAINMLEREDLVNIVPRRGIFVAHITLQDIYDLFQLREEIDPFITKLATPDISEERLLYFQNLFLKSESIDNYYLSNLDNEFHSFIAGSCKNKYLIKIMDGIYDQNQRIRILAHKITQRLNESIAEHLEIIRYLLERDADKAADSMRKHVVNSRNAAFRISNN